MREWRGFVRGWQRRTAASSLSNIDASAPLAVASASGVSPLLVFALTPAGCASSSLPTTASGAPLCTAMCSGRKPRAFVAAAAAGCAASSSSTASSGALAHAA